MTSLILALLIALPTHQSPAGPCGKTAKAQKYLDYTLTQFADEQVLLERGIEPLTQGGERVALGDDEELCRDLMKAVKEHLKDGPIWAEYQSGVEFVWMLYHLEPHYVVVFDRKPDPFPPAEGETFEGGRSYLLIFDQDEAGDLEHVGSMRI